MGESWPLFLFLAGLTAAWSLVVLGVVKALIVAALKPLAEKIEGLKKNIDQVQALERQMLEMKADLPLNYVRKEDFIRHEVVINTKLDRLRDLMEDLKEKIHGGNN